MKVFAIPISVLSLPGCERLPCLGFFRLLASCYEEKFAIPIGLRVLGWDFRGRCAAGRKDTRHYIWKMDERAMDRRNRN